MYMVWNWILSGGYGVLSAMTMDDMISSSDGPSGFEPPIYIEQLKLK
jgi:hypothetical protein